MLVPSLALCLTALAQGQANLDNLDFKKANLSGWAGGGFYLTGADPRGPSATFAVCSSDAGNPARLARLQGNFVVPAGTKAIHVHAHAAYGKGCEPEQRISVRLLRANQQPVQKKVRSGSLWIAENRLLGRSGRDSREYAWDVAALAGQTVHLVLEDQDDRPGCHLFCTGFRLVPPLGNGTGSGSHKDGGTDPSYQEFANLMLKLHKEHKFPTLARYDSKRFLALSNAGEKFTGERLRYCETIYDLFYSHFQDRGFTLQAPPEKLMLAVFDSHAGFEAYLGRKMPFGITGIYHPGTNRLVIYDLRGDPNLLVGKDSALKKGKKFAAPADRNRVTSTIERQFDDLAHDINLATTMHEVAHQLSFNSGMLNRTGDIPIWLAEGLATYCEATDQGSWQTLGSPNPGRIDDLRLAQSKNGLIPIADMIRSDGWLNTHPLLGYAQSWSLFRMLLHERPKALREYLALIHPRLAPEHRFTDFLEAFGDLEPLQRRYQDCVRQLVESVPPTKVR